MKATTFGKAGTGIAAALALSLGVSTAAFASGVTAAGEDPTSQAAATDLVGVGSDTTQDVVYGLSQASQGGITAIKSWTATGGTSITYRSGLTVARPNGSGAGYKALTDSIGLTAAGNAKAGDVDFARASGVQGVAATGTTGLTTDIPFAVDTMSIAVPSGSPFLLTNGGAGLTMQNLSDIYAGVDTYINTSTGDLATAPGAGLEPIQAFLPKPGSGSRQFFLKQLSAWNSTGIPLGSNKGDSFGSTSTPTAGAPYVGSKTTAGTDVQEHDATVLTSAPSTVAAIAPFSGAKYIGYVNGKIADPDAGKTAGTDYKLVPFDSTVLNGSSPEGAVLPYQGTAPNLTPNPAYVTYAKQAATDTKSFSLTRSVFNIIPTAAWKNPTANAKYALLNKTFVGASSDVCQATSTIQAYGFLPASNCGDTSLTFDATPSTATVTVSNAPAAVAGGTTTVTVSVQSNGNGGGKAALTIGGAPYTVTIPAGATSGTVSVPTPTAGTLAVTGTFNPNLAGVAPTQISGSITVAANAPSITSVKISGKAKVGKTVKAVVVTTPAGQTVTYQWLANGKKVKGGTKASLKLTNKLKVKGKKLTVKVTLGSSSLTSAAVKVK